MNQPNSPPGAAVDNRHRRADDRHMDNRLTTLEANVAVLKQDVALIRSNYVTKDDIAVLREDVALIRSNYATKEDIVSIKVSMLEVMNAQTWKFVTWTTAAMGLWSAGIYFIARNVH